LKVLILLLFFVTGLSAGPFSVPTPPELSEQVRESEFIVRGEIDSITQTKIRNGVFSVQVTLKIKKTYKAQSPLPSDLDLSFMIMPGTYGKMLIEPPKKGEYIVFLQSKSIKDVKGKTSYVVVLYDPNPFAMQNFTPELEEQVQKQVQ
jgi:hypothetical protein